MFQQFETLCVRVLHEYYYVSVNADLWINYNWVIEVYKYIISMVYNHKQVVAYTILYKEHNLE